MTPIFADFETFWSQDHSLSKMSAIDYVMHKDTEIMSIAYINGNEEGVLFGYADILDWCNSVDWSKHMLVGHNMSGFDALIFAWLFNVKPAMWGCTMAMAQRRFQSTCGVSLKAVAAALDVGEKGSIEATNTKGKRLKDLTGEEIFNLTLYNAQDTRLCKAVFKRLVPDMTALEMRAIDITVRMLVEPMFVLDTDLLYAALHAERLQKQETLKRLMLLLNCESEDEVRTTLMSAVKFSELLVSRSVKVPMKVSPSDNTKLIPALAKTDQAFLDLQEHDDPVVAAAARARLSEKSTLLETRIESFLSAGKSCDGSLPVPLKYYAATTGRWGGTMYNLQNLPRIDSNKPKLSDALRSSMCAPKGYRVVVVDLSGIELRVNHFLWKVQESMALFQQSPAKADLYKSFASTLYSVDVADVSKQRRQIGKIAQLGLGFGSGAVTFQRIAKMMGGVELDLDEATKIVKTWRWQYADISRGWRSCQHRLADICNGHYGIPIDPWGMCVTAKDGIKTPTGFIHYPSLRRENDEWLYGSGRNVRYLTGPKVDENIVQHLARNILTENLLTISERYKVVHTVHDEVVCIVPEDKAEECLSYMECVTRKSPAWWPEIVLWSEGGIGYNYGEAK